MGQAGATEAQLKKQIKPAACIVGNGKYALYWARWPPYGCWRQPALCGSLGDHIMKKEGTYVSNHWSG